MNNKPTHPGEILLKDVIEPLGLTISDAAKQLGITRKSLSNFVHEHTSLTSDLAIRIAIATNTSIASWLNMQTRLDVWKAEQKKVKNVKVFKRSVTLAHA
jgi:antitoxin HigA-1